MQDYRDIPLEVLRDFALTRSHITSLREVADDVGLSHSALHKFATGRTNPQPRVRRLLGLWYLRRQAEANDIDLVRPYVAALKILLSDVPGPEREAAQQEILPALVSVYDKWGQRPRWVELLAEERQQPQRF